MTNVAGGAQSQANNAGPACKATSRPSRAPRHLRDLIALAAPQATPRMVRSLTVRPVEKLADRLRRFCQVLRLAITEGDPMYQGEIPCSK